MCRQRLWLPIPLTALSMIVLAGCGQNSETLIPVTGKVLYRGVPLNTGTIVFTPDTQRGGRGSAATAEIQKDGSYRLRTEQGEGAPAGWHRVTVQAFEMPLVELPKEHVLIPRSLIPEKYRDPELSGLVREVKPGKENQIDLDLE
jgi:hypothetical protein